MFWQFYRIISSLSITNGSTVLLKIHLSDLLNKDQVKRANFLKVSYFFLKIFFKSNVTWFPCNPHPWHEMVLIYMPWHVFPLILPSVPLPYSKLSPPSAEAPGNSIHLNLDLWLENYNVEKSYRVPFSHSASYYLYVSEYLVLCAPVQCVRQSNRRGQFFIFWIGSPL